MIWVNFFHIYQPPNWEKEIIKKVARESYIPFFEILKRNPKIKITLNISASLTEQLVEHNLGQIIDDIKFLAARGQIEFTHSAHYHIILPLLPEEIALRQIRNNEKINNKYLGKDYKPTGFFPPEMCWADNLIKIFEKIKIDWVILDEISFNNHLGEVDFNKGYKIKNTNIKVLFRNRTISNYFSFEAPVDKPEIFWEKIKEGGRSKNILLTAMDGENLGHHRFGADRLWESLINSKGISTAKVSELLKQYKEYKSISPSPASWSTEKDDCGNKIPCLLWKNPNNPIHIKQWELTSTIITLVEKAGEQKDKKYKEAISLLDKAVASDQYWWASMSPWWSKEIVIRETEELARVIEPLKSIVINERQEVEKLLKDIVALVTEWQDSGRAKKASEAYLEKVTQVPYMGGKKITNS